MDLKVPNEIKNSSKEKKWKLQKKFNSNSDVNQIRIDFDILSQMPGLIVV